MSTTSCTRWTGWSSGPFNLKCRLLHSLPAAARIQKKKSVSTNIFPHLYRTILVLYILLALLGAFLWSNRKVPVLSHLLIFYFSQLLFNWLWTPVFFGLHLTYWSLLIIIIIFFITMYIILKSWCDHRLIAYILIPYIVWVSFAGYLNLTICKAYI